MPHPPPRLGLLILEDESPGDLDIYAAAISSSDFAHRIDVHYATNEAEALALAARCSIIATKAHSLSQPVVDAMRDLRWIQSLTSGTDHLERLQLPDDIIVTSTRGMHGPQMAELAILMMLSLARDFPLMLANQRTATWHRYPQPLLQDKVLLIVGVGEISLALASRAAAFGMSVHGISDGRCSAPNFETVRPYRALPEKLCKADFVVLLSPYEPRTHGLVDAKFLATMAPHAYLVNLSRGRVVDEAALAQALRSGSIAGAAFDVFSQEPLPADDPLWAVKNLQITPHIGGMSDRYAEQAQPVLCGNLAAYIDGSISAMTNVVKSP